MVFKELIENVTGWLRALINLGLAVIMAFVLIDILFPGTTGVVNNIEEIVGSFSDRGVVGLIALLIFLLIYRR
jgi:hypothetical protein